MNDVRDDDVEQYLHDDFDPVYWTRDRLDREALAAQDDQLWLEQTRTIQQQNNPGYIAGIDPGIREYSIEPLGSHRSDSQPCPPYWDSHGLDNGHSQLSKAVRVFIAVLFGLFGLAVMFVGFGGLNLVGRLRGPL